MFPKRWSGKLFAIQPWQIRRAGVVLVDRRHRLHDDIAIGFHNYLRV